MIQKAFSIRDAKTESFGPPFCQNTHGEAERTFHQLATSPDQKISKYPEDFDLYHVGEYDDQSGKFFPLDTPQHMLKAVQVINR